MQVGVGGERHPKVPLLGRSPHRAEVPAGIHDQGAIIAEVDQVGAVAQPSSTSGTTATSTVTARHLIGQFKKSLE
jgi:hypothetical protein